MYETEKALRLSHDRLQENLADCFYGYGWYIYWALNRYTCYTNLSNSWSPRFRHAGIV
jgi:hypothetical protein